MIDRRSFVTIGVAALVSPLGFLSANATRSPSLVRIALVTLCLLILGLLFRLLFLALGALQSLHGVESAVAVIAWSFFGFVDPALAGADGGIFLMSGTLFSLACGLLTAWLGARFEGLAMAIRVMVYATALAPVALLLWVQPMARAASATRDVVVLFVDGYASAATLTEFGFDNASFYQALEDRGFQVEPNALSSYSMTYASIASTLGMGFPVTGGESISGGFRHDMYRQMGGDNSFVAALRAGGYRYVHVESGWSGTKCGATVDRCVRAPVVDETTWNLVQRTAAARLIEQRIGHSFVVGGLATIDSMLRLDLANSEPELVVAHLLLPHPPMFLDEECRFTYSAETAGLNLWAPYLGASTREDRIAAYLRQLSCTNHLLNEVAADSDFADAIMIIVGDHGSDSRSQLVTPVTSWNDDQIDERLHTILAIKGCEGPTPDLLVNALGFVLQCLGSEAPAQLEYRGFLVPVEENHPTNKVVEVAVNGR